MPLQVRKCGKKDVGGQKQVFKIYSQTNISHLRRFPKTNKVPSKELVKVKVGEIVLRLDYAPKSKEEVGVVKFVNENLCYACPKGAFGLMRHLVDQGI